MKLKKHTLKRIIIKANIFLVSDDKSWCMSISLLFSMFWGLATLKKESKKWQSYLSWQIEFICLHYPTKTTIYVKNFLLFEKAILNLQVYLLVFPSTGRGIRQNKPWGPESLTWVQASFRLYNLSCLQHTIFNRGQRFSINRKAFVILILFSCCFFFSSEENKVTWGEEGQGLGECC